MVRKLIKHELINVLRTSAIPVVCMILLAILARVLLASNPTLALVLILFYILSIAATVLVGFFFGIVSFYKAFYTGEGYMTLSLPVTADQLIWAKLISALIIMACSIFVCLLSSLIFFVGLDAETLQQISEELNFIVQAFNSTNAYDPLLTFESCLFGIISIPFNFLFFYCVMSVAQLFTVKNRSAVAILSYIGIVFVWSILRALAIDPLMTHFTEISPHLTMWIKIVATAGAEVAFYFIVRYIIRNKVNLIA